MDYPRELVVDPFLGIGNAALPARVLGVGMAAFEIDEAYLSVAASALDQIRPETGDDNS